jgi:hypothetical protein
MQESVGIHPHAEQRAKERGGTREEIGATVLLGESFPAKFGRTGFRMNFPYAQQWNGKTYETKQIEAYCVWESEQWLVITVLVKYF